MDLEQLQATRAQLLYEFGEIEYEKTLHIQRLNYLEEQSRLRISELQKIEGKLDEFNESMQKFKDSAFFNEKNDENILKSE